MHFIDEAGGLEKLLLEAIGRMRPILSSSGHDLDSPRRGPRVDPPPCRKPRDRDG